VGKLVIHGWLFMSGRDVECHSVDTFFFRLETFGKKEFRVRYDYLLPLRYVLLSSFAHHFEQGR
jgi:hypothetical protein